MPGDGHRELQAEPVGSRRKREISAFLAREPDWIEAEPDVLTGPARIPRPSGGHYTFQLRVELPFHFPSKSSDPTVTVVGHDLGAALTVDDHVPGGKLCLQVRNSGDIDYAEGGLPELITQVAIHLWRVVLRKHGGTYPGPARSHFPDGLYEDQRDRLHPALQRYADPAIQREIPAHRTACPCGTGRRFADCCEVVVRSVRHEFRAIRRRVRDLNRMHPHLTQALMRGEK
ncbi:SEC-C metal-binding domain-containing protein [Anaeromyxobacter sp. PSR-1]|uniref:SEC-C metal-binding domain-containing protein n=1 Tax=Anaeromyxobacter sp. PSR-1 TaxID=1300915 RepID=UPI001269A0EE